MFAVKVQSVIWMDHGSPRDFKATYIFPDGFASKEACIAKLKELLLPVEEYAFIRFRDMWYAVSMHRFDSHIVVAEEGIVYSDVAFQPHKPFIPMESVTADNIPKMGPMLFDNKTWQDGIVYDLYLMDGSVSVEWKGEILPFGSIPLNNLMISFGLNFFQSEIAITNNDYISHVFSHFYNENSMRYQDRDIRRLHKQGYTHYNPFTKTTSRNKDESNEKLKQMLGDMPVYGLYERDRNPDGSKVMRDYEIRPTKIYPIPEQRRTWGYYG